MPKLVLAELTNKSRGSQKSRSLLSDMTEGGTGDGEGESEGQAESSERRSENWPAAASDGGLTKTVGKSVSSFWFLPQPSFSILEK